MLCNTTRVSLSFLILLLLLFISSSTLFAEGRPNPKTKSTTTASSKKAVGDEKVLMMRPRIGSTPPRCERRCRSCARCEPIQVPTNPQAHNGNSKSKKMFKTMNTDFYSRGDENTNYKPMSWKCKCGNFIFNP